MSLKILFNKQFISIKTVTKMCFYIKKLQAFKETKKQFEKEKQLNYLPFILTSWLLTSLLGLLTDTQTNTPGHVTNVGKTKCTGLYITLLKIHLLPQASDSMFLLL